MQIGRMMDEINYGSETIVYRLEFKPRKTLGITVTPELKVVVKAPEFTPLEKVRDKVRKRASWILNQQSYFLSFHPRITERKYVSGETHLYLGRQYRLKVTSNSHNEVKYLGGTIEVRTANKENTGKLMKKWYRSRAEVKFPEIAGPIIEKFKKYQVKPVGLFIQEMPTRWGSCTPKGKIILNPELIKAPRACIEYVITHELCHLVERNHTQKFFEIQSKEMPDWKKWKDKLESLLA